MRQPAYNDGPLFGRLFRRPRWSWTLGLVLVNVAVFLVESAFSSRPQVREFCYQYLALSLSGLKHGYVWQLVTYQFMHASFQHILFNCWGIFVFGRVIEELLGAAEVAHHHVVQRDGGRIVSGAVIPAVAAVVWG